MERMNWDEYFMEIAKVVSSRATCFSPPKGAVIVKDKAILSTGYNGAPSGTKNCRYEIGSCNRRNLGFESGKGLEYCRGAHAEANAIARAALHGHATKGSTLYCTHQPCAECSKMIINSQINKVYYLYSYNAPMGAQLLSEANIELIRLEHDWSGVK